MIIGISGKAGSGKDTLADILVRKHGFVKVALADPMKRFCMELFGFTEEQLWGKSEKRNEPDKRYPRENSFSRDLARKLITDGYEKVGAPVPDFVKKEAERDTLEYLTPRCALQTLGTEWGRNCYKDVWVDYALRVAKKLVIDRRYEARYAQLALPYDACRGLYWLPNHRLWEEANRREKESPKGVVIPDIRFKNELVAIQKVGKVVRIVCPESKGLTIEQQKHASEAEQEEIPNSEFDYLIENTGTLQELELKVDSMMGAINGRMKKYDINGDDETPPFKRDG